MNDILVKFLFLLSGALIALGLVAQVEIILARAMGVEKLNLKKAGAFSLKIAGFALLGYLLIKWNSHGIVLNSFLCAGCFFCIILLYLLAKHFLVR